LDAGRVDREVGIKQVGEADAKRLGSQPQVRPVSVEAEGATATCEAEARLLGAVDDALIDTPAHPEDDVDRLVAEPARADDVHWFRPGQAHDTGPRLKLFQTHRVVDAPRANYAVWCHDSAT